MGFTAASFFIYKDENGHHVFMSLDPNVFASLVSLSGYPMTIALGAKLIKHLAT